MYLHKVQSRGFPKLVQGKERQGNQESFKEMAMGLATESKLYEKESEEVRENEYRQNRRVNGLKVSVRLEIDKE